MVVPQIRPFAVEQVSLMTSYRSLHWGERPPHFNFLSECTVIENCGLPTRYCRETHGRSVRPVLYRGPSKLDIVEKRIGDNKRSFIVPWPGVTGGLELIEVKAFMISWPSLRILFIFCYQCISFSIHYIIYLTP